MAAILDFCIGSDLKSVSSQLPMFTPNLESLSSRDHLILNCTNLMPIKSNLIGGHLEKWRPF
jgi:hypothetical protein